MTDKVNHAVTKKMYDCSSMYNCCDCGGNNCGCAYCFSCHACNHCLDDDGEPCDELHDSDDPRYR